MVLLFLLAALYGGRGSAYSQDSGSDMGHLWFVVQIGAKWSYKTIVAVHYNHQYNILNLEEKSSSSTGNMKRTVLEKNGHVGSNVQTIQKTL